MPLAEWCTALLAIDASNFFFQDENFWAFIVDEIDNEETHKVHILVMSLSCIQVFTKI